jgi:hypothetical protein
MYAFGGEERVHDSHVAVVAPMRAVFGEYLRDAVDLCVGPQVSIEPREPVHRGRAQGGAEDASIRVLTLARTESLLNAAPDG